MSEITEMLRTTGSKPNLEGVFRLLYPELKRLASARLASLGGQRTLTPTALVHEAYIKLVQAENLDLANRRHFFACCGKAMRNIVIDHLRSAAASKRGGDQVAITLTENLAGTEGISSLLDLDQALDELEQISPRQAELVEMKFFAGLPLREIAELMEISDRTCWREWQRARAFLHTRVNPD